MKFLIKLANESFSRISLLCGFIQTDCGYQNRRKCKPWG